MKNKTTVEICGREYSIVSEETEEYVAQLASGRKAAGIGKRICRYERQPRYGADCSESYGRAE